MQRVLGLIVVIYSPQKVVGRSQEANGFISHSYFSVSVIYDPWAWQNSPEKLLTQSIPTQPLWEEGPLSGGAGKAEGVCPWERRPRHWTCCQEVAGLPSCPALFLALGTPAPKLLA